MAWFFDPTIRVGSLTLVALEIVPGIDNLILDRHPKARPTGLSPVMPQCR
ncbi:hypothetical protein [Massilia sp. CCM 8734]|nr:hypothetical protein [Massilia sp. CCM 8734]